MSSGRTCFRWAVVLVAVGLGLSMACSGSSPTQPPPPSGNAGPSPSPSPSPSSNPVGSACATGKGDVDALCHRGSPSYLGAIDAAIDKLASEHPEVFRLDDTVGPGGYLVLNVDRYFAGVIANLQQAGYCAGALGEDLQVKKTDEFSEEYDILLSSFHVRRGNGSYSKTCNPAAFPVDPGEVIARVPIFIFGYQCPDDRLTPDYGERKIPLGCTALVTATPKDKNNKDVDPRIHGPEINWSISQGADRIDVHGFPDVPFNLKVTGVQVGHFGLCAKVKGKEGCMDGDVIP